MSIQANPTAPMSRRDWLLSDRPQSRTQARLGRAYVTWRQFSANRLAVVGLVIIIALLLMAAFADVLATHSPVIGDLRNSRLLPPGSEGFILGTDDQGRDIFSRLIYGSRLTLMVVVLVAVISAPIGLLVGTVSGYAGGWVDAVLMRITDIFLAFPKLVLALAFVAALGPGIQNAIIAIAITSWPPYARIARAETLTVRRSDYISAVRLMGASPLRIVVRHVMPLCISSLIVRVTLDMAGIILTAAGLGFLGLGAQPPLPEWGAMIASGRRFILDQWWVAAMPGIAILSSASASTCSATACVTRSTRRRADNDRSPDRQEPQGQLSHPHRRHRGGARRLLHARQGTSRHRRRIRLRKIPDRPRHHGPHPRPRRRHRRYA
jgi:peptide/nickel transport system permease protein